MASKVGSSGNESFDLDPTIPAWKRELLLRRRALTKSLHGQGGGVELVTQAQPAKEKPADAARDWQKRGAAGRSVEFTAGSEPGEPGMNRKFDGVANLNVVTAHDKGGVLRMGEDKNTSFGGVASRKGLCDGQDVADCASSLQDVDQRSDSSEEFQYGPGIVSKLKTKYLSMTLREKSKGQRPSLSNLRRATSLENWLDNDDLIDCGQRLTSPSSTSSRYSPMSPKMPDSPARINKLNKFDSLKRARSMEVLTMRDVKHAHHSDQRYNVGENRDEDILTKVGLVNEDIIIIENNSNENEKLVPRRRLSSSISLEETELPPHDVVIQAVKKFDPNPRKVFRKVGVASRVANLKINNQRPLQNGTQMSQRIPNGKPVSKPLLSPKPAVNELQKSTLPPKSVASAKVSTRKISPAPRKISPAPRKVSPTPRNASSPTSPVDITPVNRVPSVIPVTKTLTNNAKPSSPLPNGKASPPLTNGSADTAWIEDRSFPQDEGTKTVSKVAIENIRQSGMSIQFVFGSNNKDHKSSSHLPKSVKSSPKVVFEHQKAKSENKPETMQKQVGVIKPMTIISEKPPVLTEREIENNKLNKVKSMETSESVQNKDPAPVKLWSKKPWHQEQTHTMVFNFKDREVPNHVENDGQLFCGKREKPKRNDSGFVFLGSIPTESSDFDDDTTSLSLLPPSPCDINFVGDNIIINGKSSIRKNAKPQKLRISFNDDATTTFEYPSEASLLDDPSRTTTLSTPLPPEEPAPPRPTTITSSITTSTTTPSALGALASYTPSTLQQDGRFELGVTPTISPPPPSTKRVDQMDGNDDFLKPATESETVTWSAETAADILF